MSDYQRISVEQAQRLLATENTMLLDMRDARAYCQGHDPRATRLSELNLRTLLKSTPNHVHLIICCEHGHASRDMAAVQRFRLHQLLQLGRRLRGRKDRPQRAHASPCAYNSPAPWQWVNACKFSIPKHAYASNSPSIRCCCVRHAGRAGVWFPRRGGGALKNSGRPFATVNATGTAYPREAAEDLAVADLPAAVPAWRAGRRLRHHPRPKPTAAWWRDSMPHLRRKAGWGECRLSVPRRS